MASEETLQKEHEESGSDEEVEETVRAIEIDVTKLTPLSPEVISKQVRCCCSRTRPYSL